MYECIKHSSEIYRVTEMKMIKVRPRVREKKEKKVRSIYSC